MVYIALNSPFVKKLYFQASIIRPYLYYGCRSLFCHVVDGILVSQPVGSFHCVVEMPPPVIILHVSQSCIDPTLRTR